MSTTITRPFPAHTGSISSPSFSSPDLARPLEEQKVLERAAAPKHLGAAIAKKLRGMVSSNAADLDLLKDNAKEALHAYNVDPSADNKRRFLDTFRTLQQKEPPAEIESANPSWGQTDNPAYTDFVNKIAKLQQAYNILNAET